jgi:hypothetical protein
VVPGGINSNRRQKKRRFDNFAAGEVGRRRAATAVVSVASDSRRSREQSVPAANFQSSIPMASVTVRTGGDMGDSFGEASRPQRRSASV